MSVCKKKSFPMLYTREWTSIQSFLFLLFGNCKWKCIFYRNHTHQKRVYAFSSVESGTRKKAFFFFFLNIATERIPKIGFCLHLIEMFGSEIYTENTHTHRRPESRGHFFLILILSLLLLLNFGKLKCVRDLDAPTKNHHSYRHHNNHHHQQSIHPTTTTTIINIMEQIKWYRSVHFFFCLKILLRAVVVVGSHTFCCCLDHIILFC